MREFKIYPSNLRRHERDTNNRTKFTYVRVNLIFQPSLASGKPRIERKKENKSINTGKVFYLFFSRKLYHKVKLARPRTTYCIPNSFSASTKPIYNNGYGFSSHIPKQWFRRDFCNGASCTAPISKVERPISWDRLCATLECSVNNDRKVNK